MITWEFNAKPSQVGHATTTKRHQNTEATTTAETRIYRSKREINEG